MAEKKTNDHSAVRLDIYRTQNLVKTENYKLQVPKDDHIAEKIYDPYEHRILEHPNNYLGAFTHIVKSSLGTGILAVPRAYKSSGLLVGVVGNTLIGILCTHAVYILVQASQKIAIRNKVPSLGFPDTAEEVFKQGPKPIRKWSGVAKLFIEIGLAMTYYLSVAVYMVFISVSLTKLVSFYYPGTESWDKYIYKLIIMSILMFLCQIREIKFLVPFSFIANISMVLAFSIIGYYIFSGIGDTGGTNAQYNKGITGIPSYFSTILYAMEGIGAIMPVENSMPKPNFLGVCGVLNSSMVLVVFLFTSIGFLGYYRFGEETDVTITKNLPSNEILAQVAQAAIAISVFFTFMLQFYVPTDIIWQRLKCRLPKNRQNIAQIILRVVSLLAVTVIAIFGGENLGSLIDIIGAICFASLGLLAPAILDIIVNWKDQLGIYYWKLIKNIVILILAIFGMISGTYYAILHVL